MTTPLYFLLIGQSMMLKNQDNLERALWAAYPDCKVIKCAVGGTSIQQWQRGQEAYQNAVIEAAKAEVDGFAPGAILCFIGQTNAHYPATAGNFRKLFWAMLRDLRIDIEAPNLPVIYANLGDQPMDGNYPAWGTIKQQLLTAADAKHPALVCVDTDGCGPYEKKEPFCHLLPGGLVELTAREMAGLATKVKPTAARVKR
jgi:hypothetical protein